MIAECCKWTVVGLLVFLLRETTVTHDIFVCKKVRHTENDDQCKFCYTKIPNVKYLWTKLCELRYADTEIRGLWEAVNTRQ